MKFMRKDVSTLKNKNDDINKVKEVEEHEHKDCHSEHCCGHEHKHDCIDGCEHEEHSHGHCHCHDAASIDNLKSKEEMHDELMLNIIRLLSGILLGGIGLLVTKFANAGDLAPYDYSKLPFTFNPYYYLGLLAVFIGYIVLLFPTIKAAVEELKEEHSVEEEFLVTISCIGAFFVGAHFEGLMVAALYELGELLQDRAVDKSRRSIAELMDIKPEYANVKVTKSNLDGIKEELEKHGEDTNVKIGDIVQIHPDDVKIGDTVVVKAGEKVPLDGVITKGEAHLNTASLTGESKLLKAVKGDAILSGSINEEGLIEVKVTSDYEDSTVQKILDLVENATEKKAKTETFVSKATKIYTPIVIALAIVIAVFLPILTLGNIDYATSIYRALIFLVISCPCAIAISIPLSYFSGIGKASSQGILIKGSNYIDSLSQIKTIVFDKTGTLTMGVFEVDNIFTIKDLEKGNLSKNFKLGKLSKEQEEILHYAALGESFSNHPIAKSILKAYSEELDKKKVKEYKEIAGQGISYIIDKKQVYVGNDQLVNYEQEKIKDTCVYVKVDDNLLGVITLADKIKEGSKEGIAELKAMGIKTKMYTGDNSEIAKSVSRKLKINNVVAKMLPQDKYKKMEELIKKRPEDEKVAFVGDGINDSPVLALSDVGFGMGGIGSSSSIEASDVVIMTDNIAKIPQSIRIAKKTCDIVKQNLIIAFGVKVLVLLLSSIGVLGMFSAVFADVGVTLICVFNTFRILKDKNL